ncbi:MAG: hypothetical protein QOF22_281 [Bradyrhizobium sp.]|nr:hypothetical protein [Bradyrhizobium sp.]
MTYKASGRSALILATGCFAGLLVCFAGPSQAAADVDNAAASSRPESAVGAPMVLNRFTRHNSQHWKSSAHPKSSAAALKSSSSSTAAAPKVSGEAATEVSDEAATEVRDEEGSTSTPIPPSMANANAQMASADIPGANAKAMSARANDILQAPPGHSADVPPAAETQIVASDQLNDVDRALQENKPLAATLAMASADKPVMASNTESSTWDQTSLIGKIFIGFGTLLTMASAARMFMA